MKEIFLKDSRILVIRRPSPADAAEMICYLNRVGGESPFLLFGKNEFRLTEEEEKAYIETFNRQIAGIMLVGMVDGEIVSVAQISTPARRRVAHVAELAISVRQDCWDLGVGTAMMKALIAYARHVGIIRSILLTVSADNQRAKRLYEKCGFSPTGHYHNYIRVEERYYDADVMELIL